MKNRSRHSNIDGRANLTENQKQRIQNIEAIQSGAGLIGSIGGIIYANRTGGGFWRYVGYFILGGLVVGLPTALIMTPFKNKILKEGDKEKDKIEPEKKSLEDKKTASAELRNMIVASRNKMHKMTATEEIKFRNSIKNINTWAAKEIIRIYDTPEANLTQADKNFFLELKQRGIYLGS